MTIEEAAKAVVERWRQFCPSTENINAMGVAVGSLEVSLTATPWRRIDTEGLPTESDGHWVLWLDGVDGEVWMGPWDFDVESADLPPTHWMPIPKLLNGGCDHE